MESYWLISYIVLWILVLCLGVAVLAHSRLLGILHHRFGPAHAKPLADGPAPGTSFERLQSERYDGTPWRWEFPAEKDLLLVFLSPQCDSCDRLMPHVRDFARSEKHVAVVLLSVLEDRGMNEAFIAYRKLRDLEYVRGVALSDEFEIGGTPYTVWLDRQGVVRAKGLANHQEHLMSLAIQARQPLSEPETADPQAVGHSVVRAERATGDSIFRR
jgi:methylamine dehydrogenase accessory protein MauD